MQDTIMRQQYSINNVRSNDKQSIVQKWIDNPSLITHRRTKETRRLVRESFKSTEDVYTEVLHMSLSCPITKKRIKLPCVSTFCEHVACFDGEAFLRINKSRAIWHCPLCNQVFDLEDMRIDSLIERILKNAPKEVTKVAFNRDADYTELVEIENKRQSRRSRKSFYKDEVITLDDNAKDSKENENEKEKEKEQEKEISLIIILDSDNDDDVYIPVS